MIEGKSFLDWREMDERMCFVLCFLRVTKQWLLLRVYPLLQAAASVTRGKLSPRVA